MIGEGNRRPPLAAQIIAHLESAHSTVPELAIRAAEDLEYVPPVMPVQKGRPIDPNIHDTEIRS